MRENMTTAEPVAARAEAPGKIFEHHGCRLHYWIDGPAGAPLVVFSHGAMGDHSAFDDQIEAVTRHYRMLRWDLRGHGRSRPADPPFNCERAARDLAALLDALGEHKVALVGASVGGDISQEFLFRFPDRCAAVLLLGCTCLTRRVSWLERLMLTVGPFKLMRHSAETLRDAAVNTAVATQRARERFRRTIDPLSKREIIAILAAIPSGLHYEPGYRIACPIAIAHGAQDGLGKIKPLAVEWAARDGAPPPYAIPDAGHLANMDNPQAFNRLLMDFLAAHVPPSPANAP